jgi:hypothetical protein
MLWRFSAHNEHLLSLVSSLSSRRWLRHVRRMPNNRISKQVLYGELSEGRRSRGRPKTLIYKDVTKFFMLSPDNWEELAADHTCWRAALRKGVTSSQRFISARLKKKMT